MKKYSLTIGIPAHNEEQSLPQLLASLKKTVFPHNFVLTQIILVSDGSVDATNHIIQSFSFNKIKVIKIIDSKRRGKIFRLNQLFKQSNSDYLLIIDADIRMRFDTIPKLLTSAVNKKAVLTVAHQIPLKPTSVIGQIIYTGYQLWDDIRTSNQNNLDNVQNFYGAFSVYSRSFYRYLNIPKSFHDERKYIYYLSKKYGSFYYDLGSVIFYHPVSTLRDFYTQSKRSGDIDYKINQYFKSEIRSLSTISWDYKLRILLKHILKKPLYTTLFLLLRYIAQFAKMSDPLVSRGMWTMTQSTKKGFSSSL